MADVRYMTCSACTRTLGADLGSTTLKVGICKMCREDPTWLDRFPDVRKAIERSDYKGPSIGLRFKNEKRKKQLSVPFDKGEPFTQSSSGRSGSRVAQNVSHPESVSSPDVPADPGGNKESNPMGVRVGQLWRSLDARDRGRPGLGDRHVLVKYITSDCRAIVDSYWINEGVPIPPRRERALKLHTFIPRKGRGFELVSNPDDGLSGSNPYSVKAGQRWRAVDPRRNGAVIEVESVDEDRGVATYVDRQGKKREVALRNFTKTKGRGYVLESS